MRLHLQLRDQTCRFPGCTRTASTAEADHTLEWRNGGETSLDNLVSLCTSHHHVRHGEQWSYDRIDDHGTLVWTSPTGRRISNRPPPLPGRPPDPPPSPRFDDAPMPF
ncbi:HNH endonuclease signature motif containing protein [Rathayibacter festucae]|uniref:HNH endonuclease signature motif containing protein n=1 Tax=Rathayibacter festucae TaxID=110937 RepID=UPI002A6B1AD2|nr:HNH endonuclease signature motif containing protein [Rathayibacter festucae]MDY0913641.1 HNH endonuclease signature motif containing protein [Rathayibacter festucae]